MKTPLQFAKIVPTPSIHAWAQAYNAGNLIAVLSLVLPPEKESVDEISLPVLGKDLINTLEAEYFTLETKNLITIKQAINSTIEKIPSYISLSFCVSVIIENVIYVYLSGPGKIIMKRKDKVGVLLEQQEEKMLVAGSGYIENGDVLLLETQQFSQSVPTDMVSPYLSKEQLHKMAEAISLVIHEKQIGGAAAIAFSYSEEQPQASESEKDGTQQPHPIRQREEDTQEPLKGKDPAEYDYEKPKKTLLSKIHFSHTRKLILTIICILIVVFGASIFFSTKKQKQTIDEKLYQQTVIPAQKKYDEGQSLLDLNKNLALEDFQNAKQMIAPATGKFPADSKENKDTVSLVQRIDDAVANISQTAASDAKQVDNSVNPLLSALLSHANAKYVTQDDKSIYVAGNDGITAIGKNDSKENQIIKNSGDWKDIGGFETYLGNFYVLDKSAGILKYTPSKNDYGKSNYFSGSTPDLSKASGIAIDGSIWILGTDGTIAKYTRGKQDSFSIKGIDKPLANPSRIYTSVDSTTVYILDTGNKRIVALDKNGTFLQQYPAGIISKAQDFQIDEKQKKIYILNAGKIWDIDLK